MEVYIHTFITRNRSATFIFKKWICMLYLSCWELYPCPKFFLTQLYFSCFPSRHCLVFMCPFQWDLEPKGPWSQQLYLPLGQPSCPKGLCFPSPTVVPSSRNYACRKIKEQTEGGTQKCQRNNFPSIFLCIMYASYYKEKKTWV